MQGRQYDDRQRFFILPNDRKETENHPDMTGSYTDDHGNEYWVSAWVGETRDGRRMISGSIRPKDRQSGGGGRGGGQGRQGGGYGGGRSRDPLGGSARGYNDGPPRRGRSDYDDRDYGAPPPRRGGGYGGDPRGDLPPAQGPDDYGRDELDDDIPF